MSTPETSPETVLITQFSTALQEFGEAHKGRESPGEPPVNPLLLGLTPGEFVLRALGSIRAAELEQALLLLPFSYALDPAGLSLPLA